MSKSDRNAIRFGKESTGPKHKSLVIGGGAVALILLFILIMSLSSENDDFKEEETGCKGDRECGPSRICIAGGCLPFLESEHRGIWRDDVRAQLDAGAEWSPQKTFGVKLTPSKQCPAGTGKVEAPPLGRMSKVAKTEVFELGKAAIIRHQQVSFKGTVWIDALRLRFPPLKALDPGRICTSASAVKVAVDEDSEGPFVDVSLKKAAPAGQIATTAVALELDPPKPDSQGFSTLAFELAPAFEDSDAFHTVLAVPIGSEVAAIEGAVPFRQRLLTGFVTYYFRHTARTQKVRVRYSADRAADRTLDITEVNP